MDAPGLTRRKGDAMKIYDVLYKRDEKQGKGIWLKCGIVQQRNNGKMSLKLDAIPINFDGWLVISERRNETHG
jgi:hypothetical protein